MALLNFGNAIAGFGKAAAALGLESVKATLEHDKVRLAAELAAEEGIRSDKRRADSATALAGVNTAKDTAAFDRSVITAQNLVKAQNKSPQALAQMNASLATEALATHTLTATKALNKLQTDLSNITDTAPLDLQGRDAKAQRADLKRQISALQTTNASIAADKTGAIARYAAASKTYTEAVKEQRLAATAVGIAATNDPAAAATLKTANDFVAASKINIALATEYMRLTNPDANIESLVPAPDPEEPVGDPGKAAAPGSAATPGNAPPRVDTLLDGTPITEMPSPTRKAFDATKSFLNSVAYAVGEAEQNRVIIENASTYKAIADELNKMIPEATPEKPALPHNYRENLLMLLRIPKYKGYLNPAALALAEKFKAEDDAAKAATTNPVVRDAESPPVDLNKFYQQ